MGGNDAELTATLDLVVAARQGSSASLAQLYERTAPMLLAWAHIRIRPSLRASVDGDDLLQETWSRAVGAFARYDPSKQTIRPWLLGIARLVLLENLRRIARSRVQAGGASIESSPSHDQPAADITTIRTRLAKVEEFEEFVRYAQELGDLDRSILLHCGFEELPFAEVAQQLGLDGQSLGKRWQRLRAKLRESRFARKFELNIVD